MKKLLFPLILLVVILAPLSVFAASAVGSGSLLYLSCYDKTGGCGVCDIVALLNTIVRVILQLAGIVSLVMFIWGGLDFVMSAGSPDKIKSGKQKMIGSVTGILIIYSAWVGVNFLVSKFTNTSETAALNNSRGTENNSSIFSFGQWNRLECISEPESYEESVLNNNSASAGTVTVSATGRTGRFESTITINGHSYAASSLSNDRSQYATISPGSYSYRVMQHDTYGKCLIINEGGDVPTIEPNPNRTGGNYGEMHATGIYVHRWNGLSTGCITVESSQWNDFMSNFQIGQTGTIVVSR